MKKLFTLLALIVMSTINAQAPQGFNYQATVRNSAGALIVNQNVYFKFNVMLNSATSVPVFSETHYVATDDLGQVNLTVGQGTATTGTFAGINWASGTYYLGIELNTGSGGYVAMGTTQLLSVPYALYANSAGSTQSQGKTSIYLTGNITNAQAAAKIAAEFGPYTENIYIKNTTQLTSVDLSALVTISKIEISNNSIVLNDKLKNIESNFAYIRNLNFDIFTKLKKSCSQICTVIDDVYYVGFGWFYYDNTFDLKNGFFITAAHCVMEIKNNMYCKASVVYIMNPIDNNWILINVNNIFIDGIGDIALIKTGINLKEHADYCLKLANADPMTGDMCYIVGNATGTDDDLISMGSVRNPNYCDTSGFQTTSSIHVTCIGLGGNTGGPMVNLNGDVIGIYTFGLGGDIENFGGGLNRSGLSKSLEILKTQQDNKQKRYLGLDWIVPGPFLIKDYYELNQQFKSCIYIQTVCSKSPFFGVLDSGDLLLNATLPSGDIVEFGNSSNQRSPGILIYNYELITIQISYIKKNQKIIQTETINLNVSYYDLPNFFDGPLQTGLKERQSNRLVNIMKKMQKNTK